MSNAISDNGAAGAAPPKTRTDAPKRGLRPGLPTAPWNPWLGAAFVVVVFIASGIFSGVLVSLYPWLHHWSQTRTQDWLNDSVGAQFTFVLLAEAFSIGALYMFLRLWKFKFSGLGLKRPRRTDPLYGLMAFPVYFVLYLIVLAVITHFVPGLNVNQQQELGFNDVHGVLAMSLTLISLVVLPAVVEEIMVRGFLYSSLKKALPAVWAAVLTSALFASAHLPEGGSAGPLYIAALDTFVLSLVLIYLREKTGNLWASITLHAAKNSVAFVTLFVLHIR
ncbi:MAG: lysostaphin resistance A-like protein [Candidatus Saccharimonadales bacterium]